MVQHSVYSPSPYGVIIVWTPATISAQFVVTSKAARTHSQGALVHI